MASKQASGTDQEARLHDMARQDSLLYQFGNWQDAPVQAPPKKPARRKAKPAQKKHKRRRQRGAPCPVTLQCSSCSRREQVNRRDTYHAARVRCSYCGGPLNRPSQA
jgi:hypothetical protein